MRPGRASNTCRGSPALPRKPKKNRAAANAPHHCEREESTETMDRRITWQVTQSVWHSWVFPERNSPYISVIDPVSMPPEGGRSHIKIGLHPLRRGGLVNARITFQDAVELPRSRRNLDDLKPLRVELAGAGEAQGNQLRGCQANEKGMSFLEARPKRDGEEGSRRKKGSRFSEKSMPASMILSTLASLIPLICRRSFLGV